MNAELIARIREALDQAAGASGVEIGFAVLFGSAASGRLRADSDLDIGIAADIPVPLDARLALADRLAQRLGRPVDLVDLRTAGGTLLREALVHGIVVAKRNPQVYADLLRKHVYEQADFEPLRAALLAERRRRFIGL